MDTLCVKCVNLKNKTVSLFYQPPPPKKGGGRYSGISGNCNSRKTNYSKTTDGPENKGEKFPFIEERRDLGGLL